MKRRMLGAVRIGIVGMVMIFVGVSMVVFAQSPRDLFNQALIQERAAGNLEQAIQFYQRAAKESGGDRTLAAQALIGAARSYEKLGRTEASNKLYAEVARTFPEQRDQAQLAQQRLADTGLVEGTVTRVGTGEAIPNATISLSGGPIDPTALESLTSFFADNGVAFKPPAGAQLDSGFMQALTDSAAGRGMSLLNPTVTGVMDEFRAVHDSRFTAVSDAAGRFSIKNVPPGRYVFRAEREGFFRETVDPFSASAASEAITVAAGRSTSAALSMIPGAIISGRITDSAGQPQTNAPVTAYTVVYQNGLAVLQEAVARNTDDRGNYRLFWLPAGEYLIAAFPGQPGGPPVPIRSGPPPAGGLGGPLGGGPPPPPPPPPPPLPAAAGKTYFPGTADVSMALPVVVRNGAEISGIDIETRRVETYSVSGEIRSHVPLPAGPEGGILVPTGRANLAARDLSVPDTAGPSVSAQARLDPTGEQYVGKFEIKGVLPGSYDLRAWTDERNPDGGAQLTFAAIPIEVHTQNVTGVSLDIYPSVRVNGQATIDGHAPGQTTVRVSLQVDGSAGRRPVYQSLATRSVIADGQSGTFMIPAVTSGKFRVQATQGLPPELYVEDVRQGGISVLDSGFDVGREPPSPIQVMLRSGAAVVEGIVRDAAGRPVSGATIVLVPPPARRQNRTLYRAGKSDASGRFRITGVAPGDYELFAWQSIPEGAYYNSRFLGRYQDRGRPARVTQNSTFTVEIPVIP